MKFIAEIGLNHNGNFSLAREMIRQASICGADIVKFQLGWRDKQGEINCIDKSIIESLMAASDYYGLEFCVSIITEAAWELIKSYPSINTYKIASRTVVDNPQLVRTILDTGKQTIISLGMWDRPTLPFGLDTNISYLWCRSKYPCLPSDLTSMPKDFSQTDYRGYSDHSLGIETALLAIARRAEIIEKHFTLDKSDQTIRDHTLSASPEEFAQLVSLGREIRRQVVAGV